MFQTLSWYSPGSLLPNFNSVIQSGSLVRGDLPFYSSPRIALSVAYKLSSCCKNVSETQNRKNLVGILKVNTFSMFLRCGLNLVIDAHTRGRVIQEGKWGRIQGESKIIF